MSKRFEKIDNNQFGSAPIGYNKVIFTSKENEERWNKASPQVKKALMYHINNHIKEMSHQLAIEMMSAYICEIEERITKLEAK